MFNNVILKLNVKCCTYYLHVYFIDKPQPSEQNLLNYHDGLLQSSVIQIDNVQNIHDSTTGKLIKIPTLVHYSFKKYCRCLIM